MENASSADYQKLYSLLFNRITDALEQLEQQNFGIARNLLIQAQQEAEEVYLCENNTL